MKWVIRIAAAVVVLVVVAIVIVIFSLNSIVRAEVERQSAASLNVPTTLAAAELAILGGNVSLTDLEIGSPATFTAVLPFPHPVRSGWREHRTVCLPDFQGVGLGNAMSEFIASLYVSTGKPYYSTTSHPAMMRHRAAARHWRMTRKPQTATKTHKDPGLAKHGSAGRLTAGFEYIGPARPVEARRFGLKVPV